ncbi:MAG TPA: branched-chain amino acid ABC transporter ATP-binding protein/permease, partial [Desulfobacteraceae bacterium]|nr:branched-chain amino acid ABC transporter ATP-binding protein/permease [Desulfobacteraceae bacterium]
FLKLRLAYLAMATLGLGEVFYLLAKDLTDITGGMSGIIGIPYLHLGPVELREDWQIFYLFMFFVLVFIFLTDNIGKTRLGRAYHAIRTNETAAQAMGIHVQKELGKLFCFSALISSLSGSMLAHFITFISPQSFTLNFSFTVLIIVIIGGANVWGGLITTVVLIGLSEFFRGLQDVSLGLYGLVLILSLFIFPEGLAGFFRTHTKGTHTRGRVGTETSGSRNWGAFQNNPEKSTVHEGKLLELHNISMRFGGTQALFNVSLDIHRDQIVGIIGPNGAGKTTLLNIINGFLTPQEGLVILKGEDMTETPPYKMAAQRMGRTFQLLNLFRGMTVIENVMVGCHLKGRSGIFMGGLNMGRSRHEEKVIHGAAMQSLDFLGLVNKAYDLVENLSYGEQKLVELARALAMEPALLLLDEPAAGLNSAETEDLSDILRRIRGQGITIVLVEHNMPLVMTVSDSVFVLDFGRGIASGTPEEVSKNDEVIRAYLGQGTNHA